ncbi:hypothetical protein [Aquabacterium sp.]|uniref:hypothetical protein n=1 Tax=Aquabacterium sp. TaxID=1872578 RepID=UPI003D6C9BED
MIFNNKNEPVVDGFTLKQWVDMVDTREASEAHKSLDYFDGQQEQHVQRILNDPHRGRANWADKGIHPITRNVTKMVVEKSGMIFKDRPPVLEVYPQNSTAIDQAKTMLLSELLARTEFTEFCVNLDHVVRLLKTAVVLTQWDADQKQFTFDLLHRGNCEVVISPSTRKMIALIHRTSTGGGVDNYQLWTLAEVLEIEHHDNGSLTIASREANTFKAIPATVFYDTNIPRTGFWVEQDKSLVRLNEEINLHYTDSAFALMWQKMQTPVTNLHPAGSTDNRALGPIARGLDALGLSSAASQARTLLAGPGDVVVLDSQGVDNPFFDWKGPKADLVGLENVVNQWIKNYASDWSVRTKVDGEGSANSGFQLIVEELPNLDLRATRQRMFEQSFKRLYKVVARVYNTALSAPVFSEDAELFAQFHKPKLPVDQNQQEIMWTQRINDGRATVIDYLIQEQGMTKDEADAKYLEIIAFNKRKDELMKPAESEPPAEATTDTQASNLQAPEVTDPKIVQ